MMHRLPDQQRDGTSLVELADFVDWQDFALALLHEGSFRHFHRRRPPRVVDCRLRVPTLDSAIPEGVLAFDSQRRNQSLTDTSVRGSWNVVGVRVADSSGRPSSFIRIQLAGVGVAADRREELASSEIRASLRRDHMIGLTGHPSSSTCILSTSFGVGEGVGEGNREGREELASSAEIRASLGRAGRSALICHPSSSTCISSTWFGVDDGNREGMRFSLSDRSSFDVCMEPELGRLTE